MCAKRLTPRPFRARVPVAASGVDRHAPNSVAIRVESSGRQSSPKKYRVWLTGLRDALKAGLSGGESKEGEQRVAELAERIKALRAGNQVEAVQERTARKVAGEGTSGGTDMDTGRVGG